MIVKNVQTNCSHCGLPVPVGLLDSQSGEQFCCHGCASAFQLIRSSGLDSFYRMANSNGEEMTLQSRTSASGFAEYDEPVFLARYSKPSPTGESTIVLSLDGIHCGACIWLLEKLPTILPGVNEAIANWSRGTITVRWQPEQIHLSRIARTLHQLGYSPSPFNENSEQSGFRQANRKHLIRIGIAAAAAGNNMIISAALYLGMFSYMTWEMMQMLRIFSCVVGVAALLWPGRVFLQGALAAVRTRTPHMDLPIALGLTVGTVAGLINVLRGTGEIYFDSLSVLIFLLLIGRWIQFRQQTRAANAVAMLSRLTPRTTRKLVDGRAVETLVDLIQPEDLLEIRHGDCFPVDGVIVDGSTQVDESILTGESRPVSKSKRDPVLAGTENRGSVVVMAATAVGPDTRLNKIVELVEQASLERPQIVQWANRIGGYFVTGVIVLATLTFVWWVGDDVEIAVDRTVALLIVACPCALALAAPLTISSALGRAARRRIMVKSGDVLQSLQNPGIIWLDKTGTLTTGQMNVERWYGDQSWLPVVAALEERSAHPVARAIIDYIDRQNFGNLVLSNNDLNQVEELAGSGICGKFANRQIRIGNRHLMEVNGVVIPDRMMRIAQRIVDRGLAPCWLAVDTTIVGIVAIGDSVRDGAKEAIDQFRRRGWQVGILSGDHTKVVDQVAKHLGIEQSHTFGEMSPEKKVEKVKNSSASQTVVMVGDGVNDSAALAAATVGVAVKNGAEASLSAAPVYLARPGLEPVMTLMELSRSAGRTMKINLTISLTYNLVFATLAFAGYINPLVAAILMPISSLTVVALSLSSGRLSTGNNS